MAYPLSLLLPLAILIPNIIYFGLKKDKKREDRTCKVNSIEDRLFSTFETLGQIGVFFTPIMSPISIQTQLEIAAFVGMVALLLFYYSGWVRFFLGNQERKLLVSPFLRLPVPLALSSVVYFFLASVILHSNFLFFATLLYAAGHIRNNVKEYNRYSSVEGPPS